MHKLFYSDVAKTVQGLRRIRKEEPVMEDYIPRVEHEEFAKRIDDEQNRQNHRLAELEKATKEINSLTVSVEKMALSTETMARELGEQGKRLDHLESVPGKNWTALQTGIINALAAAIGGGIAAAIISFM